MWHYFNLITYISVALWLLSGTLIYSKSKALRNLSITAHLVATLTIGVFIVALWQNLDRPPLRTLAETRIWYAFFMGLIGCAIYWLYRQKWMLSYSAVMGIVFIVLTYTHPRYNEQSPNACLAERVVHSTRNRVYLCLCNVRDGFTHRFLWHLSL